MTHQETAAPEVNQRISPEVLNLAKSLYHGPDPWESLASSFRAHLIGDAMDRLARHDHDPYCFSANCPACGTEAER